jgi:hypothetical protein
MASCTQTTLCDKVCQLLVTGQWFSPGTSVSSTNKMDCHDNLTLLISLATKFFIGGAVSKVFTIRSIRVTICRRHTPFLSNTGVCCSTVIEAHVFIEAHVLKCKMFLNEILKQFDS